MFSQSIRKKILSISLFYALPYTAFAIEQTATIETQIKQAVVQISSNPSEEMQLRNAVKHILQEQEAARQEREKQNIIALIVEASNTNGSTPLFEKQLRNTLDDILKNTSVDIQQRILEYRKTFKTMQLTQAEQQTQNKSSAANSATEVNNQLKGWMYIGQFIDQSWQQQSLNIDGLPEKGQKYLLNVSANVLDSLPTKKQGMSNVISRLSSGKQIKVLNLHHRASSNTGHYWALVEWLK